MARRNAVSARRFRRATEIAGPGASTEDVAKYYLSPVLAKYFGSVTDRSFLQSLEETAQRVSDAMPQVSAPPSPQDIETVSVAQKSLKKAELTYGWLLVLAMCIGFGVLFLNRGKGEWFGFLIPFFGPGIFAYIIGSVWGRSTFMRGHLFRNAVVIAAKALCFERRKTDYWRQLSWRDLELQVTALFGRLGYNAHVTPGSGDKGVDVVAESGREKVVIQCKQYSKPAQRNLVSELLGVMVAERASRGILVCTGGFTQSAEEYAAQNRVELWDLDDLARAASG